MVWIVNVVEAFNNMLAIFTIFTLASQIIFRLLS